MTRVGIDRRKLHGGNHRRVQDFGGLPFTMFRLRTMAVAQSRKPSEVRPAADSQLSSQRPSQRAMTWRCISEVPE